MFNLGKLSKMVSRNLPAFNYERIANNMPMIQQLASFSELVHQPKAYIARTPQAKNKKVKEKTSAPAFSDEKSAKLSKAEEEAETKRKKMEARGRAQAKGPIIPPRNQTANFETKFDDKRFEEEAEKIKKRGLFMLDEERAPSKEAKPKEPVKWIEPVKATKTLNDIVRKETPSLKRKVGIKMIHGF